MTITMHKTKMTTMTTMAAAAAAPAGKKVCPLMTTLSATMAEKHPTTMMKTTRPRTTTKATDLRRWRRLVMDCPID